MLETTKSITLSGTSRINGSPVVSMSANISTDNSNASANQTIINSDLYQANKTEVRKDISDFQAAVYDVQDQMSTEGESDA